MTDPRRPQGRLTRRRFLEGLPDLRGEVALTAFSVPASSLEFWHERLTRLEVPHQDAEPRFDEPAETEGGTSPVGAYPDGASPYGALDMLGRLAKDEPGKSRPS